jgi:hypothetical protein
MKTVAITIMKMNHSIVKPIKDAARKKPTRKRNAVVTTRNSRNFTMVFFKYGLPDQRYDISTIIL